MVNSAWLSNDRFQVPVLLLWALASRRPLHLIYSTGITSGETFPNIAIGSGRGRDREESDRDGKVLLALRVSFDTVLTLGYPRFPYAGMDIIVGSRYMHIYIHIRYIHIRYIYIYIYCIYTYGIYAHMIWSEAVCGLSFSHRRLSADHASAKTKRVCPSCPDLPSLPVVPDTAQSDRDLELARLFLVSSHTSSS